MSSIRPSTASSASERSAHRFRSQAATRRAERDARDPKDARAERHARAEPDAQDTRSDGSAVVEFILVGALLTVLTLAVMQLGLALHVRNTVLDAAAEGARVAALADNNLADGIARTEDLIRAAIGPEYAKNVRADYSNFLGSPATVVTVTTALPLIGLIGIDETLEVSGHAAREIIG